MKRSTAHPPIYQLASPPDPPIGYGSPAPDANLAAPTGDPRRPASTAAARGRSAGYSSLSYIAKLPLTSLKIDRAFITGMTEGPHGMAIVSSTIALAHALKLTVVAEGVETEEQARMLRLLACDEAQGYLYS